MKRLFAFLLLALWGMGAWAQAPVADSTRQVASPVATSDADADDDEEDNEPNVIGGRVLRVTSGEANLFGSPVYYNPRQEGVRPAHHYLNSYRANANAFFLEGKTLLAGHDQAFGLAFAYVPGRWGGYVSAMSGSRHNYVSAGPVLRLSSTTSQVDWQLYGGVMGGCGVGAEGGIRIAQERTHSHRFCWNSASVGMAWMNGRPYFTCGLSLELGAIVLLAVTDALLFW